MGDRVGIFTLRYLNPDEIFLGDSGEHLDVLVSVCERPQADAVGYGGVLLAGQKGIGTLETSSGHSPASNYVFHSKQSPFDEGQVAFIRMALAAM